MDALRLRVCQRVYEPTLWLNLIWAGTGSTYRPKPAVLEECARHYFDIDGESPVMMREGQVLNNDFPAITHVDGSARIQTVTKKGNERFYKLIQSFQKISGFPVILSTSFNLPGKSIVETPTDALNTFGKSALEYLCTGNYLLSRSDGLTNK